MPSYLTESSNAEARNYALQAAKDGKITYSVSSNTSTIASNWIDRIYEYTSKLIGIEFEKVVTGADFRITLEAPDYKDLYPINYWVNTNGLIRWTSVHNTKQYGGVEDQRTLVRAIGNSLGLSRLNWRWREAGNTGKYTTKDTIMSDIPWDRGFDWGHTVFFTEDDKTALKAMYNSNVIDGKQGDHLIHIQRIKEDLLIGANGQIDEFRLTAKGMNADNEDGISYDPITGWYWVNDYNIPTIVNFNPQEGDKIVISRRLYMPDNPIHPTTPIPSKIRVLDGSEEVDAIEYLNSIYIDFKVNSSNAEEKETILSDRNTMFNDAGKLILNVNGKLPYYGPQPVTGNGQLLAYVDEIGNDVLGFKSDWLSLTPSISSIQDPFSGEYLGVAGEKLNNPIKTPNTNLTNNTFAYNYYRTNNYNSNNTSNSWNIYLVDNTIKAGDIVSQWFGTTNPATQQIVDVSETKIMDVVATTWAGKVQINRVAKATDAGGKIEAKQIDFAAGKVAGSVISGGKGNDDIKGYAGWDNLEGGDGSDLIHGGNGRDIISGGAGRDELHGDFGWNTYKSEKDGESDLIAIKSDQFLVNWLYGKAGNSPNGEKADIIEGLDPIDKIKIIGVDTHEISFAVNISTKGTTGIGIYGKEILEA